MPIGAYYSLVGRTNAGSVGAAPVLTSFSPEWAETDGYFDGAVVTIALVGSGFTGVTDVTIDGNACTNVTVVDDNNVTADVPAGTIGLVDVTITGPGGSDSIVAGFEYVIKPSDLAGIYLWVDAELGITESGGDISDWEDQSGGGHDLTQSTGGLKPTWAASAFGSRHAVRCSPSKALALSAKHGHAAGFSWSCVVQFTSSDTTSSYAGDAPLTVFGDSTSGVYNGAGFTAGTARHMQYIGSWTATDGTTTTLNDGAPHHIVFTHSHDVGATVKIYVDGTLETSAAINYNVVSNGIENIGSGYSHQDGFDGDIGEAIVCDGVITSTDVTDLYNRSKRVWGVA